MGRNYLQGVLTVQNLTHPEKYVGKRTNEIIFRSSWERSFFNLLDRTESILEWSSEEICITYINPVDRRKHRYFPDIYMKFKTHDGRIREKIVEIKPYEQTIKPTIKESWSQKKKVETAGDWLKNCAKWASAREWCLREKHVSGRDISFEILTEKDIIL